MSRRLLSALVAALFLSLSGCLSLENSLVFQPQPGAEPRETPPAPIKDLELTAGDGTKIHARWAPHPAGQGAIIFCHGNGGNIEGWGRAVRELWQNHGESVLIFDYPGYGYSEGKPSEQGCYLAADAAYDWLVNVQKISPERIIIYGESLGSGVAVDLAGRKTHRALVLVKPFTSVPDVADHQVPFLPASALVFNRFDNLSKIKKCRRPVFIASGDADKLIPLRQGQQLAAACPGEREFCVMRGVGHLDPLPWEFHHSLRRFLEKLP